MKQHTMAHSMFLAAALLVCSGAAGNLEQTVYASGFEPGARVVLLADQPDVEPGLTAGRAGTVICCEDPNCAGALLVSWDLWTGGRDEEDRCAASPVGPYPTGSAAWVDPATVLLGQPFDRTGILRQEEGSCLYLETEDGKFFNLVIGREFLQQWWSIIPNDRVRIRGLLNTSLPDPAVERPCPQRDGDLYHPIVTPASWTGMACCDRFLCEFRHGDRVVLVGESNPNGAVDLPRGTSGTIVCCRSTPENSVLVSWDLWTNGGDDDVYVECTERLAGYFPPGSSWWVSVEDIAKYLVTDCGSLQEIRLAASGEVPGFVGVGLFVATRGLYYLPDLAADALLAGNRFRASGLYAPYGTLPTGLVISPGAGGQNPLAQILFHSVLLPCPPHPSCCNPSYGPGERVGLLVNEPRGAMGLFAETGGTVICCNGDNPDTPILVSWDFWTGGWDDDTDCDCCALEFPENSVLWMACSELERLTLADLYDLGERYRSFAPSTLIAGKPGQGLVIQGMIGNRGGEPSGPFVVSFFASTDAEITQADYRLGSIALNLGGVGGAIAFSRAGGEFPTTIPAGTYYVGWLIDADDEVEEHKETNNMVVIEAGRLTVVSQ